MEHHVLLLPPPAAHASQTACWYAHQPLGHSYTGAAQSPPPLLFRGSVAGASSLSPLPRGWPNHDTPPPWLVMPLGALGGGADQQPLARPQRCRCASSTADHTTRGQRRRGPRPRDHCSVSGADAASGVRPQGPGGPQHVLRRRNRRHATWRAQKESAARRNARSVHAWRSHVRHCCRPLQSTSAALARLNSSAAWRPWPSPH